MSLAVAYTALLGGVLVWLFLVRRFSAMPWATPSTLAAMQSEPEERIPAVKIGLWAFMGVVTSLFALFISAYFMRMGHGHGADAALNDWRPVAKSPVLWLNTFILVVGSLAMQWARAAASRGEVERTRAALLLGGALSWAFVVGQLYVWRELRLSPAFSPLNPAIAFFYLLTAVHGLHLLGGLYVWGRAYLRLRTQRVEIIDLRLSLELCSAYWHFLLFVWLVLFGLLLAT